MEFIQRFFLYVSITAVIFLIIGLFKPWVMLWWEDIQTRKKIIKVYGTAALVGYVLYWSLFLIE